MTGTRSHGGVPVERLREPLPTRVQDTPDLPAAYHAALERGLGALGLDLPASARAAIDGHVRLLLTWTRSINLTAIRDPEAAAIAHVVDSIAAVPLLRRAGVDRFLDLGSGGGFPGLPLAVALPVAEALLVEPVAKKARFLEVAAGAADLTGVVHVAPRRAESLVHESRRRGGWPAVTARAVAATAELVELAFPLLRDGGILVAWKRGDLDTELAAAARAIGALGGGTLEVVDVAVPGLEGHRLVVATRRGRVPDAYPRDPAARRRRPW
jgi:16S rRNA (guanine527-N7)-methyltransferase